MSTLAIHRNAIQALLASVPGAGIVHLAEPYAKTQAAFQTAYQWTAPDDTKQLRGWFIVRVKTRETAPSAGRTTNSHTWKLQGFMALAGDGVLSALEWDEVVEDIRAAFRNNPTLGGVAQPGPLGQQDGAQVVGSAPVMFAGVLCHATQLELQTHALF